MTSRFFIPFESLLSTPAFASKGTDHSLSLIPIIVTTTSGRCFSRSFSRFDKTRPVFVPLTPPCQEQ